MVDSEKIYSSFVQSVDSCVLASYAIAANYFTGIDIKIYFKAYCLHYGIKNFDRFPYLLNNIQINNENIYELAYNSHFHTEYNRRNIAGLKLIEELHNKSIQHAFLEGRKIIDIEYFANVFNFVDVIDKKLKKDEALLILAFTGERGGRHIAVFGYDKKGYYNVETRPNNRTGIVYCDSPFKEKGDALLVIRKKETAHDK